MWDAEKTTTTTTALELTSTGQEDFDGDVLQEIAPREDGADLGEVPFAV